MRIAGEWLQFDDGSTRPVVRARVVGATSAGTAMTCSSTRGADRTVLSAALLA